MVAGPQLEKLPNRLPAERSALQVRELVCPSVSRHQGQVHDEPIASVSQRTEDEADCVMQSSEMSKRRSPRVLPHLVEMKLDGYGTESGNQQQT